MYLSFRNGLYSSVISRLRPIQILTPALRNDMVPKIFSGPSISTENLEPTMTIHHAPQLEPCIADYTASLVPVPDAPARVYVTAQGMHPTSGYEVQFHRSPMDVYPPEFSFWHISPPGPVLEVLTPFISFISFEVRGEI